MIARTADSRPSAPPAPAWPFLLVLVVAPYLPSIDGEILSWDDRKYLSDPAAGGTNLVLERASYILTSSYFANYNPLHRIGYWIQRSLWHDASRMYHVVSLAMHAACVLLAFRLALRLGLSRPGALLVAALFGVHPTRVEVVSWISAQKDLGAAAFLLVALNVHAPVLSGEARNGVGRQLSVGSLFGAALLWKSAAVVFPVLLAVLGLAWRRPLRRIVAETAPLVFLSAAFCWLTVGVAPRTDPIGGTWTSHLATTIQAPAAYLVRFLCPVECSARWWVERHDGLLAPGALLGAAFVALLLGTLAVAARGGNRRAATLAIAWPLACLLPVLNLVPLPIVVADRYLYLAALGPALTLGAAWARLSDPARGPLPVLAAKACAAGALAASAALAWTHATAFRSDEALWTTSLAVQPHNPAARMYLALELASTGTPESARRALGLLGDDDFEGGRPPQQALVARARVLRALGRDEEASRDVERAVELSRHARLQVETALAAADIRRAAGRHEEAHAILNACVPRCPDEEAQLASSHAETCLSAGDLDGYLRWNEMLLRRSPFDPILWLNREAVARRAGDLDEAARCGARFRRLCPDPGRGGLAGAGPGDGPPPPANDPAGASTEE